MRHRVSPFHFHCTTFPPALPCILGWIITSSSRQNSPSPHLSIMASWRAAGITYVTYASICATFTRAVLKDGVCLIIPMLSSSSCSIIIFNYLIYQLFLFLLVFASILLLFCLNSSSKFLPAGQDHCFDA